MSSTFGVLQTARSGLNASQIGLNITAQNTANADTTGYTRQAISQSAVSSDTGSYRYSSTTATVGQGVSVDSVYQIRNTFLDVRYRQANSTYNMYSSMESQLTSIEDQFEEISGTTSDTDTDEYTLTGLGGEVDDLNTSIKNYAADTTETTLISDVQTNVDNLLSTINSDATFLSETLTSEKSELGVYINGGSGDTSTSSDQSGVDGIIESIQNLNTEIANYEVGGETANELRDSRNVLLDTLSSYIDITTTEQDNGMVTIQLQSDSDDDTGKYIINSSNVANELDLSTNTDSTTGQTYTVIRWGQTLNADGSKADTNMYTTSADTDTDGDGDIDSDDVTGTIADVEGGIVKAYLNVINGDGTGVSDATTGKCGTDGILYYQTKLNDLATAVADAINTTYQDASGTTTELVTLTAGEEASSISISTAWKADEDQFTSGIDSTDDISTYLTNLEEALETTTDGVTETSLSTDGDISTYSGTIYEFASSFAKDLASSISGISDKADTAETTSDNLDDERDSISSVSTTDEGVNLIKYQQAYDANARIVTAIDEMLDKLINDTGVVGL